MAPRQFSCRLISEVISLRADRLREYLCCTTAVLSRGFSRRRGGNLRPLRALNSRAHQDRHNMDHRDLHKLARRGHDTPVHQDRYICAHLAPNISDHPGRSSQGRPAAVGTAARTGVAGSPWARVGWPAGTVISSTSGTCVAGTARPGVTLTIANIPSHRRTAGGQQKSCY
jgi:hypothetical protein